MTQDMVYLGKCSTCTWEECVSCGCWVWCSVNVNCIEFVRSVSWVFCILIDLLSTCPLNYWEKGVDFQTLIVDLSTFFPFTLISSCCMYFDALLLTASCLGGVHSLDELTLLYYKMTFFIPGLPLSALQPGSAQGSELGTHRCPLFYPIPQESLSFVACCLMSGNPVSYILSVSWLFQVRS